MGWGRPSRLSMPMTTQYLPRLGRRSTPAMTCPTTTTSGNPILTKYRLGTGKTLAPQTRHGHRKSPWMSNGPMRSHPEAHILLVEAKSTGLNDLVQAVGFARPQKGVSAVSMSWDGGEFPSETKYDYLFTTPKGHIGGNGVTGGITFVGATGDTGAPTGWPAVSPNVLGVGGTTMDLSKTGAWSTEYGWDFSGGGVSYYESEPYWQQSAFRPTSATAPLRTSPTMPTPIPASASTTRFPSAGAVGWANRRRDQRRCAAVGGADRHHRPGSGVSRASPRSTGRPDTAGNLQAPGVGFPRHQHRQQRISGVAGI